MGRSERGGRGIPKIPAVDEGQTASDGKEIRKQLAGCSDGDEGFWKGRRISKTKDDCLTRRERGA